ncbi:transaldolase [Luminiphilus sp.]|nr:transaldolase [Luminiphilus sp.]
MRTIVMTKLEQLRTMTTVVADTGDLDAIAKLKPTDATTNPSLLLKAAALTQFSEQIGTLQASSLPIDDRVDQFAVAVGSEINRLIPGVISTEVDARLSFDTDATIAKAEKLIELYDKADISADRVLIKVAATWEGIRAAETLEQRGIHCNATLIFSFEQACACADAGVFLISPFVGRITDWYTAHTDLVIADPLQDPGVQSVTGIYTHFKTHQYDTVVMGASFRNTGQIEALAGCDRLTISPTLLSELAADDGTLPRQLQDTGTHLPRPERLSHSAFLFDNSQDAMACDKLSDGIRRFVADQEQLEALLAG